MLRLAGERRAVAEEVRRGKNAAIGENDIVVSADVDLRLAVGVVGHKHEAPRGEEGRVGDGAERHIFLNRSEEHTSELQSLMRISYAVFCLTKKKEKKTKTQ